MIKTNDVVQKEKNLSGAGNSQKTKVLKNDLNTDYDFSILENLDYVNFGEIEENTLSIDVTDLEEQKAEERFRRNYGNNLIGYYVNGLNGRLYEDKRQSFSDSTDLFNYIVFHHGGKFKNLCYRFLNKNRVGSELDDLCQTMFAEISRYSNKERNNKGEIIDLNHETDKVNDVLASAWSCISNEFKKNITRKNNECKITETQIKNIKKIKEKIKTGNSISYSEIRDDLKLSDSEFDTLIRIIEYKYSLDYEYIDENANSYTLKDKVDSIEVGYEQVENKYYYESIDKSIIKLDNIKELADYEILGLSQYEELTKVDRAVIYLYRCKEINDDYLGIYKFIRESVLNIDKKGKSGKPNYQTLASMRNCSRETIRRKKDKLFNKIEKQLTALDVQGGESLD